MKLFKLTYKHLGNKYIIANNISEAAAKHKYTDTIEYLGEFDYEVNKEAISSLIKKEHNLQDLHELGKIVGRLEAQSEMIDEQCFDSGWKCTVRWLP